MEISAQFHLYMKYQKGILGQIKKMETILMHHNAIIREIKKKHSHFFSWLSRIRRKENNIEKIVCLTAEMELLSQNCSNNKELRNWLCGFIKYARSHKYKENLITQLLEYNNTICSLKCKGNSLILATSLSCVRINKPAIILREIDYIGKDYFKDGEENIVRAIECLEKINRRMNDYEIIANFHPQVPPYKKVKRKKGIIFHYGKFIAKLESLRDDLYSTDPCDILNNLGLYHIKKDERVAGLIFKVLPEHTIRKPLLADGDFHPQFCPAKCSNTWGTTRKLSDYSEGLPEAIMVFNETLIKDACPMITSIISNFKEPYNGKYDSIFNDTTNNSIWGDRFNILIHEHRGA